jgi:hypothetical protein
MNCAPARCRAGGAGGRAPIAGPLSPRARARVAEIFTARLDVVFRLIREDTGCGLAEAKGMFNHLVKKSGVCHRCGGTIPTAELADCPGCEALNISLDATS